MCDFIQFIRLPDDEAVVPVAGQFLVLKTFNETLQAVFQLVSCCIQTLQISIRDLLGGGKRMKPGNRFARGRQSNIQEMQIFVQRPSAVTLRDIPMNGIRRCDLLRSDSLQHKRKTTKRFTRRCVICDRIFPHRQLPVAPIQILPLHLCTLPPFHPSTLPFFHPSILPPFHPSTLPPFHPSTLPSFHPSILPPFHSS